MALIIKISGGSMTYGGSETMSSSRGTLLHTGGSDTVAGKGSLGARKAVQPAVEIHVATKQAALSCPKLLFIATSLPDLKGSNSMVKLG